MQEWERFAVETAEKNIVEQQFDPDLSSSALTGRIDLARAMGDSDVDQTLNLAGGRGSGAWWAPTRQEASTSSCSSCTARNASPRVDVSNHLMQRVRVVSIDGPGNNIILDDR